MADPYERVNARIRARIRAQRPTHASDDGIDDHELHIQRVSREIGEAADRVVGAVCDAIEEIALEYLEKLATSGAVTRSDWLATGVRGAQFATASLRGAGGRVLSTTAEAVMRGGLSAVRDVAGPIVDSLSDTALTMQRSRAARGRVKRPARRRK